MSESYAWLFYSSKSGFDPYFWTGRVWSWDRILDLFGTNRNIYKGTLVQIRIVTYAWTTMITLDQNPILNNRTLKQRETRCHAVDGDDEDSEWERKRPGDGGIFLNWWIQSDPGGLCPWPCWRAYCHGAVHGGQGVFFMSATKITVLKVITWHDFYTAPCSA